MPYGHGPASGDSSMIAGALAVLALSAGAAVVLIRKKK
ncbi:MAG: LPXTG cell wall anchor domain-containing protein [Candidatus Pararuminococcus gallinarum]